MMAELKQDEPLTDEELEIKLQQEEEKESYTIFEFLRKETSLVIAAVSAVVTVIAACLRLASYLNHLAYLRYWNIDPSLVTAPEAYWLENIGLSFLITVTICIYLEWITAALRTFFYHDAITRQRKVHLKKAIKAEKDKENRVKKQIQRLEASKMDYSQNQYKEKKAKLIKRLQKIKREQTDLRKSVSNTHNLSKKMFINRFLVISALVWIVLILTVLRNMGSFLTASIGALVVVLLLFLVALMSTYISFRKQSKKTSDHLEKAEEKNVPTSLHSLINTDITKLFSNDNLLTVIISLFCFSVSFLFYEYWLGHDEAKRQKDFNITCVGEYTYAILAIDTDYLIAEKAEIDGNNIVIMTDEVLILPKENSVTIEMQKFDTVSRFYK